MYFNSCHITIITFSCLPRMMIHNSHHTFTYYIISLFQYIHLIFLSSFHCIPQYHVTYSLALLYFLSVKRPSKDCRIQCRTAAFSFKGVMTGLTNALKMGWLNTQLLFIKGDRLKEGGQPKLGLLHDSSRGLLFHTALHLSRADRLL